MLRITVPILQWTAERETQRDGAWGNRNKSRRGECHNVYQALIFFPLSSETFVFRATISISALLIPAQVISAHTVPQQPSWLSITRGNTPCNVIGQIRHQMCLTQPILSAKAIRERLDERIVIMVHNGMHNRVFVCIL